MKRELKLNFGELRLVQKRVTEFQDALADIDGAAAYFDDVLGKQESEAAAVLAEHHQEMAEEICYFQDILEQLEALLGNYISDMESYIMPEDENRMMLVDRNDIWWNMKQIGSNLSSAKNVAHGVELVYYSGIDSTPSPPHIYEGMSPSAQSAAWARYRKQLEESRNRKKNYDRLENFCSGTAGNARSRLEEFYDSLEEIYKKHVIEFENTDDDYKRKAAEVYDACTSAGERVWDIGGKIAKLNNDITKGIDAAIYDFVSGIFGLAFTLLKVEAAVKIAAITVPFGITPQWVKDTGKEVMEGAQGIEQILRNPGRALASLGQQVTDTVEEEGITYALSYVAADVVIGILVDKGIGKIRGMNKADDVAKLGAKVDDVVNVADDLEAGVKAVEKIDDVADTVDDVADMADDVAVFGDIEGCSDAIQIGKMDLDALRNKLGVPETDTIAVGKTDVKGLENIIFEGQSPKVRNEAGLPDLDEICAGRNIKAPGTNPLFTRHAEEVLANDFDRAVIEAGINPQDVSGVLKIHQSNPTGVCRKCIQGLANDNVSPGVLKQLSLKYPNLRIEVTSEILPDIKVTGKSSFIIQNGKYVE